MATPGMSPDLEAIINNLQAQNGAGAAPPGMPPGGVAPGAPPPAAGVDPSGAYGAGSPPTDPSMLGDMGVDPHTQAVWDEFPGTDPNTVGQALDGATSLEDVLMAIVKMMSNDEQILAQHHMGTLLKLHDHLTQQTGQPAMPTVPPGPGVGGQGLGL